MALVAPAPLGFERSPVPGATLEDLDLEAVEAYLHKRTPALAESMSLELLAGRLGLLGKAQSKPTPTVAGLLSFGLLPQLHRPEWGLSIVRVDGRVLSDAIEERVDLEGSIPAMREQALSYILKHTRTIPDDVETSDGAEAPESHSEYPIAAVREALTNALVHRDLRLSGRVAVRLFSDRMEIWNPGGLTAAVQLEEQAQHGGVSFPRNPLLASTMRTLGLMEQIGRGLPLIRRAVQRAGSGQIQIIGTQADCKVVLPSALVGPRSAHADH
ncbi:MAG: hypothetical protein H6713_32790 [Myxococcales bacterium]|nr:hypothetical protein [Myxococcales bacterium]MCB9754740.1 hypothetical protein [Myxococcales bacterium]